MSGIAGLVRFDGALPEPGLIEAMAGSMAHRGPDGIKTWSRGPVALGHCMLRTTPESLEETQPLANEDDSVVLVMDGRVDNYEELRAELLALGAPLRSRADAELVLRSYETWGRDCLEHIDGDFALVIWDARRREAFCARDRMGSRPFYYHWDGRCLAFASELHPLLALPWVPEDLNEGMVAEILAWEQTSRDETLWKRIYRLVAAHRLLARCDGLRLDEYWTPDLTKEIRYKTLEEYAEHYGALVTESVRRHSRSHKPLACEVSGGIDSSSVFAIADRLHREGRLLSPDLTGYTLHFGDGSGADEIAYARAVGAHIGREIREVPPTLLPLSWYKDWAHRYRDFPHYPNSVMAVGIREAARDAGSRVLLTGYGGDEWLMGSRFYYTDFIEDLDIFGFFRAMWADFQACSAREAVYWAARFGAFEKLTEKHKKTIRTFFRKTDNKLIESFPNLIKEKKYILHVRKNNELNLPKNLKRRRYANSMRTLYAATRAQNSESFNLLCSACGVELRDPLTSRQLVDFHFQTPEYIRHNGNQFRICHRLYMKGMLPERVRNRNGKAEFSVTLRHYLDDLSRSQSFLIDRFADLWLESDEFQRLLAQAMAPSSGNRALWIVWGIFGCAAVADSLYNFTE